jgi:hypothetical protein
LGKLPESRNLPMRIAPRKDSKSWRKVKKNNQYLEYRMALVTSNQTHPFEEVVPESIAVKGVSRSSILTQRRRVRAPAQTGIRYGLNGAAGGNNQIQFVIADAGGLLDPASVCLVYNVQTSGTAPVVVDDGHPFNRVQINLNGQNLEDIQQAGRATNAEVKLSAAQPWYRNEGSFCGFELLNNEMAQGPSVTGTAAGALTGSAVTAYNPAWGCVSDLLAPIAARMSLDGQTVGSTVAVPWNPFGGEQRCLPLGLVSGVGRMKQYLPLAVLGELNLTFFTAPASEIIVQGGGNTDGDYSLNGLYLEYDIVVPHPAYMDLLQKVSNDPMEAGLMLPFESTITATSGTIGASPGALAESSIIVSRATQNLLRAYLIQQPTALLTNKAYPSYSCFAHASTYSIQYRIGSQYFPAIPAEGDASMYAMTMLAYGTAARNDSASVINRALWRQFSATAPGGVLTPSANEGFLKFGGADSFVPAYGFQVVKGEADALDVDGISLSGASGSQCVVVVRSAPSVQITPMVGLVALRFINAHAGAVRVIGA